MIIIHNTIINMLLTNTLFDVFNYFMSLGASHLYCIQYFAYTFTMYSYFTTHVINTVLNLYAKSQIKKGN